MRYEIGNDELKHRIIRGIEKIENEIRYIKYHLSLIKRSNKNNDNDNYPRL